MTKFTFTSEFQGFGSPKNTLEFDCDQLEDVLMYFEQFLKGAGYHFDGNLTFINHEEDDYIPEGVYPQDFDIPEPTCSSEKCCGGCQ